MQTGTQDGDTVYPTEEPALVTALVAPLLKLRAGLGDGTRPDDTALAALSAVPVTVRAADDTHQSGYVTLAGTDTARQAQPVIKKTGTEVAALADVGEGLAPLLTSAYTVRDKAAGDLDTLISDFRSQATPLVKAARSQADLDGVVSLAADYTQSGVDVVKAASGQMDQYTGKVSDIADTQPQVTVPDTGGGNQQQPGNSNYPNPANTNTGGGNTQYPNNSNYSGWYGNNSNYGNNNGWNSGNNSYSGGSDYTNSKLAETDPTLAAQLTIQSAALSAGVTLGSGLISLASTLGSALITSGAQVITTGIEKGETYAEKALAANTSQTGGGTTPGTAQPGNTTPGTTTPPTGNSLTPGLADPGPTTPAADTGGAKPAPAATVPNTQIQTGGGGTTPQAPQNQPQAGVPDTSGGGAPAVIPPGVQAKPQPDNDKTTKRDGQGGVTA